MKAYLFGYGTLKHDYYPPDTMESWQPATARGEMYAVPGRDYPMANQFEESQHEIRGELLVIDSSEFPDLDKREDHRYYARRQILVHVGGRPVRAWVYEWRRTLPAGAKSISNWEGKKP